MNSVTGYWIGECTLPSYKGTQLEIWRYSQVGEQVDVLFFAYDSDSSFSKPTKWKGRAVFRLNKLPGFYFLEGPHIYESGVVVLEFKAMRLPGIYAQFDPKGEDGEPLYVSSTEPRNYYQDAIEIPFLARVRMYFGRSPYRTYAEVKRRFDDVRARRSKVGGK